MRALPKLFAFSAACYKKNDEDTEMKRHFNFSECNQF